MTHTPLTDYEIEYIEEGLQPIPDDSLDGALTWIGPDLPTMQRLITDLRTLRQSHAAALETVRAAVAAMQRGSDRYPIEVASIVECAVMTSDVPSDWGFTDEQRNDVMAIRSLVTLAEEGQ